MRSRIPPNHGRFAIRHANAFPSWTDGRICTPGGPVRGFTLVELMVTIFVIAILLAIAVPSFKHVMGSTQLSGATNALLTDLKYARTEAVSRGHDVAVTASSGGWQSGWSVVVPAASAGDPPQSVLRVHGAIQSQYQLEAGTDPGDTDTEVSFRPQGTLLAPSKGMCFTIKAPENSHNPAVRVLVLPAGTVRQFNGDAITGTTCGT